MSIDFYKSYRVQGAFYPSYNNSTGKFMWKSLSISAMEIYVYSCLGMILLMNLKTFHIENSLLTVTFISNTLYL